MRGLSKLGKDVVAYAGEHFTIEWYFNEEGESQPLEYFGELDDVMQDKVLLLFKRMGDAGKISNKEKFRNEGDQIYAFKADEERFLCFFVIGKKVIVTNAYAKAKRKLPKGEKKRAQECRSSYLSRIKKSAYY
jgi:hypothetical protein